MEVVEGTINEIKENKENDKASESPKIYTKEKTNDTEPTTPGHDDSNGKATDLQSPLKQDTQPKSSVEQPASDDIPLEKSSPSNPPEEATNIAEKPPDIPAQTQPKSDTNDEAKEINTEVVVDVSSNASEKGPDVSQQLEKKPETKENDLEEISAKGDTGSNGQEISTTPEISQEIKEVTKEKISDSQDSAANAVEIPIAEDIVKESDNKSVISDENNEELPSLEDSEYETPDPEEADDEVDKEDDDEDESNASDSGESESGGSQVLTEREDGDGQEESEKKDKKLDHDEDKRDPQYIPKKGNFYEHDDRTSETEETPQKKVPAQKPYETKERWNHDLYDADLQSPKSREELIDQYGYDIRQEEGPPKARRRRRYGRGPNKYTRSWEEVEAYTKSRGSWRGRGRGRPNSTPRNTEEEFPPLPMKRQSERHERRGERKAEDKKENKEEPPPTTPPAQKRDLAPRKAEVVREEKKEQKSPPQHNQQQHAPTSVKKTFRQVYVEEQVIVPSRGRGRGRGRIPVGAPFKNQHSQQNQHQTKPTFGAGSAEEDIATLSQHFSEAVINVDNKSIMPITQQQSRGSSLPPSSSAPSTSSVPSTPTTVQSSTSQAPLPAAPAAPSDRSHQQQQQQERDDRDAMLEKSEAKSKRYSTLRQRSLPQPAMQVQQPPTPPQPPQRFMQDQFFHQGLEATPGVPAPPPPQFTQPPPPTQFTPEVPMMAFIPPGGQFQPLYVPPPPYLPPAPLPVQAAPPRPEVYQGASGITYYNTQTQVNRPVSTSRRVKLAIPIVPPPESA